MMAHAGGSSLDEFVAQLMLFGAIALGVAGWLVHGKAAWWRSWGFIAIAVLLASGAFVVPQRTLRQRPAKIRPVAGLATVDILAPADGVVVRAEILDVAVSAENIKLVPGSQKARTGVGHLHVTVDRTLLSQAGGLHTRVDLRPFKHGVHTLVIEFVAADHGSFTPPVRDSITFDKEAA